MNSIILQAGSFLHDVNITFVELVQIMLFLGGIVGIWIGVRIKIAKIETGNALKIEGLRKETDLTIEGLRKEVTLKVIGLQKEIDLYIEGLRKEIDLKIKGVESKTAGLTDFLGARYTEFVTDNKEDHNSIKTSVSNIHKAINEISIKIAKL